MKLKELKKTVNVSWSPAEQYPIYLAAGSAAQQLDPSFSSTSQLELYSLNLEEAGFDLELKSSIQTQNKFQKLVWSGAGVIVGGCDGGLLEFYSVEKLMNNSADSLLSSITKHNGQVSALDVNPYQRNLLASGASDSEIFIWDLNNTSQPMALGNRSQPLEHVQGLAWNQQVQHILGSTFSSRCVVWDLRKNEPIMKLSDSAVRTRWRALSWHPAVATQLCLASEDDHTPVIQLWDLRLAASPLLTLEGHHSGVMSLSWCRQDPDLLLSAGKDGRVLCWNPNTKDPGSQLVCEVSSQEQWVFEAAWSPRCPALLAAAGADQRVAVYSLLGGSRPESSPNQSNIMDSFGGADSFLQLPAVSRSAAPAAADAAPTNPPKWLARPRGARFAFGGKLITFDKCPEEKTVYVSQVVSEPAILAAAPALEAVLAAARSADPSAADQLAEYCRQKGDAATEQTERYTWYFLRANFLPNFRTEALNLLGFKQDELPSKFKGLNSSGDVAQNEVAALSRGESTETEAELSTDTSTDLSDAHTLVERKLASLDLNAAPTNVLIPNGDDPASLICRALAVGRLEEAVEHCLAANRVSDAMVIASTGGPDLITKVQQYHLSSAGQDPVSLLAGCVSAGRWASLAKAAAPRGWRLVLAALLTHASEEDAAKYCELLGDRLAQESDPALAEAATLCYLCAMSADAVVSRSRSALAALAELAAVARRAASARGRTVQPGGKVESVLIEYASRLASAGCLDAAASALAGLQRAELRDRLAGALGQRQQVQPSPAQQRPAPRRSLPGHTYTAPTNPYEAQSPWQPSVPTSGYGGFAPAPAPAAPPAPPAQPPRAPSTGPSTGGITSRSKYKVDPSVQSAPLYNQYNFNNPPPQQYGYNSPAPDQYGANPGLAPLNPAPLNPGLTNPGLNQGINNPGLNQGLNNSGLNPALANPILNSGIPLNQTNPGLNQGMSNQGLNPGMNPGVLNAGAGVNGGYYQPPVEPAVAAAPVKAAPPGWNDPPMMTKPKSKPEVPIQAPITQPLFGMEHTQHIPLNPAQYPGQQYQEQQYPGQQYQDQYQVQQYQSAQYGQQQFQQAQYPGAPTQAYPPQSSSPAPPAPAPAPAPKPPLPERYRPLQAALDALRDRCYDAAANPQMKRKLEDVKKKLETLYDILREERLSESAVNSLHSCVSHAQGGDYQSAVAVSAALASGPDFAAAASFIPGLKVLFQLAQQLQVYF